MGKIIYGTEVAKDLREKLKDSLANLKEPVHLAVVLVGNNPASASYVKGKEKACLEVGIEATTYHFEEESNQEEVLNKILELNEDPKVDGILLQLPLPNHLDSDCLIQAIDPRKDVDGLTIENIGKLHQRKDTMVPCTPLGIMEILNFLPISLEGKHAVVIGRSNLVGAPVARLLLDRNATVTICHSKTSHLIEITQTADILIVAIGKPQFIKAEHVKEGAVVIDVGINRMENGKLCGDVDTDSVLNKVSYVTPVPKGVGPMTITMLLWNTYEAHRRRNHD